MIRILVIDDEDNIRLLLQEIFDMHGYKTDTAENGCKGIQMIEANDYDLVFLDKRMPVLTGDASLKVIREISDVPVYVISAFQSDEEIEQFKAMGATGFLMKPFSIAEVAEIAGKYVK